MSITACNSILMHPSSPGVFMRTAARLFVLLLALACHLAFAREFPTKPLRLLVGYAPGGPSDAIARAIARELETELKQPVVVENKAGAAGIISLEALTQSPADGYTLGLLSNSTTTALHFGNKPLDVDRRATVLAQFVATRLILAVNPKVVDVRSLAQFIAHAKGKPGLTYTSSGQGSPGHPGMELFARQKGLQFTHVPYRGSAPAMQDVVAGRVGIVVVDASTAAPFIASGDLRPVVTVSTARAPGLPDLPTALEQGSWRSRSIPP
ncbi:tripartite tricarboxylate transporter substrate binding protein [Ramlibacter terrae]|uniref:Tripartite tricarboxylate transporter substrate binding protein n=1 Tax=Ramlibacter terrae TaxID=2732511 RepID=A0ABX6P737_9BURK|nr:tripartite tricarboxylate transporter substrate binding protein [Ramlibacter terrae]